jgi:glycosyltransferase involved in cell wall biosynthesis
VPNIIEKIKPLEKLGNEVLWLGRLELSSKQYIDLIKIASVVKKTLPDIKFLVACAGDERPMEVIRENIEKFNVQENVKLEPFITDVERYYERARVHLVTSVTESFSMTIAESKSYGIPLVLYDLPHLELLKDGKGYVSVPQNDVFSAANAIIKIFTDDDYCCQLSAEAAESIIKFKEFGFMESLNLVKT